MLKADRWVVNHKEIENYRIS